MSANSLWTREQLKLAFNLYCQLPFGKLHKSNREIIELAELIGRTPSAVAMKLVNLASLDPAIRNSGRKGLGNASALDREVWEEFHADWDGLATECLQLQERLRAEKGLPTEHEREAAALPEDYTGETRQVLTEQRIRQHYFRRAVLSSYRGRCCMSGLSEPKLLIASHIVPWSRDRENRLNPSNGLCLSALHDKAFDQGFITLDEGYRVVLSSELKRRDDPCVRQMFMPLAGKPIEMPERFMPDQSFLARHREVEFLGEG